MKWFFMIIFAPFYFVYALIMELTKYYK